MKVSLEWLSEFVDLSGVSPEELGERLTLAGLEVEAIEQLGADLSGLVTAHVQTIAPHPNADRLRLVTVDRGGATQTVVCGAPNVAEGQAIILATVGATLPGGPPLAAAKIRGVVSEGMIVSEAELGLPETNDGIWVLEEGTPAGSDAVTALGLADTVIELSLTPNRPDCLSIHGVAREVAALLGRPLLPAPTTDAFDSGAVPGPCQIELADPVGCPRYSARVIEDVSVGPAPWWMRRRLAAVGVRPISSVVDVTNYVLMEWGQPLHAFDLDRLEEGRIVVRRARAGEPMRTLDEVDRKLAADDLVIADASRPVALAGVMGGATSEVEAGTTRLLLESAHFQPATVRRTARRHGLHSESSHRFERGTDPNMVVDASARAAQLILEVAGGAVSGGVVDRYPVPMGRTSISLSVNRANRLLGTGLDRPTVAELLGRIDLSVQADEADADRLTVAIPTRRPDLERDVDLAEEIARLHGYDKIEARLPVGLLGAEHAPRTLPLPDGLPAASGKAIPDPAERARLRAVRAWLGGAGFHEHMAVPFTSSAAIEGLFPDPDDPARRAVALANPLSEDQAYLRTSLLGGLLDAVAHNGRHGTTDVRLFEMGRVFRATESSLPDEPLHLGIALTGGSPAGWADKGRELDAFDLTGTLEGLLRSLSLPEGSTRIAAPADGQAPPSYLHPGAVGRLLVRIGDVEIEGGWLGELHPDTRRAHGLPGRAFVAEIIMGSLPTPDRIDSSFAGLPRFPAVHRDVALVLDDSVPAARVLGAVREHAARGESPLSGDALVFDVFRGDAIGAGRKSLAIKVRYQAADRTLTDDEVNRAHEQLVTALRTELNAGIRDS